MKKYWVAVCVAMVGLLAIGLSSWAADPQVGGTLVMAIQSSPPSIDWMTSHSAASRYIGFHIFEGLTTFNEGFEVIPQLASSWESNEDFTVWTFHLREGISFHDGSDMTAADVLASYERFMNVSPRKGDFAGIVDEVLALDDYTVQFVCSAPSRIPTILALPNPAMYIIPERLKDVGATELAAEDLVGTGPFRVLEWVPDIELRLGRFEAYVPSPFPMSGIGGARVPYVDEVLMKIVPESGTRVAGLETGEYDIIEGVPLSDVARLSGDEQFKVVKGVLPKWWPALVINTLQPPLDDLRLRQAVLAALCADEIMAVVGNNLPEYYRVDPSIFMAPSSWYSDIGSRMGLYNQCDTAKVAQLLADAGYDGEPVVLVTNSTYDSMYKASLVAAQQLQKAGFNVKIEIYDWPGSGDIIFRGDGTGWNIGVTGHTPRFDAAQFYRPFYSANKPNGGFADDVIDALIEQDMVTIGFEDRYEIWEDIQARIYEIGAPEIKLGDYFQVHATQANINGYYPWYGIAAWNVWIDE